MEIYSILLKIRFFYRQSWFCFGLFGSLPRGEGSP